MDFFEGRYDRQARLSEVGVAGQARIESLSCSVDASAAGRLEREYLLRAGISSVAVKHDRRAPAFPHARCFAFEAARDVGTGAWRALAALRTALGVGSG